MDKTDKDKNMKFLVIDDMTNMRRTIRNMLRYIGYDSVAEAVDGDHALKMMDNNQPEFIICDWNMPRLPGIELVRKTKEIKKYANIPFLMVTAEVQESQIVQAAESDIDGYIIKPFVAKTLEEKVNSILERKESPTEFDLLIKEGITSKNEKQYDNAVSAFEKALKITPKSARVRHLIGEIFQLKGEVEKAENLFQEAAKINPQYVKVLQSLGDLYQKSGDQEKAFVALERAAKISPNNVTRQTMLGKLYVAKGKVKEADQAFKAAMKVDPNNSELKTEIGEIYLESGHSDKAAAAFQGSLNIKKDVHVYNRLGIALRRNGKVSEAINEYKKALLIDSNDEALYYNIGRAYIEAKDRPKAVQFFKKALKIDPDFKDAKIILQKLGY